MGKEGENGACTQKSFVLPRRFDTSQSFGEKKVHSTLPRARSLALNLFVVISSLVLILPLWPLASKGLLIVELGKGLKIEVGEQAYHTQSEIHNGKRETGKGGSFLYRLLRNPGSMSV